MTFTNFLSSETEGSQPGSGCGPDVDYFCTPCVWMRSARLGLVWSVRCCY